MAHSTSSSQYMPQLDALRALAVLLVLVHHWLPHDAWLNYLPTGPIGVTLFFVLSGYLISSILLANKEAIKSRSLTAKNVLYAFYIRRALRIFPLYFIVIFLCLYFNVENIGSRFGWFVSYCSNILHFSEGKWMGALSHLWTLAVEEQYYLFIPFVIVFVPEKHLLKVIWACIVIGPLTRILIYLLLPSKHPEIETSVLTFSAMDCFGLGTLLAYVRKSKDAQYNEKFDLYLWGFFVMAMVAFLFMVTWGIKDMTTLALRSVFSVISLYTIDQAAKGVTGKTSVFLENKALIYIGKISYGIYIIHMFMPYLWERFSIAFSDNSLVHALETDYKSLLFWIFFVVTIGLASFSWFFLEKPLNDLKIYFEYKKNKTTTAVPHLYSRLALGLAFLLALVFYPAISNKGRGPMLAISNLPRLFPSTTTGVYVQDFNKITTDTSFLIPKDIPFHYDMVSLYLAWGVGEEFDLPVNQIQKLETQGKRVFVTWEPWTSTFPDLNINNKEVFAHIQKGAFDSYFARQASLLSSLAQPVYIRWGHNTDRLDCPWSAITHKEIQQYKIALTYVQDFFDRHAPGKVKWVWPAPQAHRLADYLPEDYRVDFVGIPAINKGKSLDDEAWREFPQLLRSYDKQLQENKALKDVPILLTEVGMEQRSTDETHWYQTAFATINASPKISHAVIFAFHKPLLKQFTRERTKSLITSR